MPAQRNKNNKDQNIRHYRLDEVLVKQNVGVIYLAHDEKTDKSVFLVTLQPDAAKSSDLTERFQRRAETLSQLEDESILPLLDYGIVDKRPFAVMAHIPGQFLAERLAGSNAPDPTNKAEVIASLMLIKQLAAILSVVHPTGLVHHDLRPEHIYLNEAGQPFLLDLVVPASTTAVSQMDSTPPTELDYASPEQLAGKTLSGRSNIFSLGVMLYRLLSGHKPALPVSEWDIFEHKGIAREVPLQQVRPDLTEATYTVVEDCLWQKEWSRFETVSILEKAIDRAIKKESAPPPPPPPAWQKGLNTLRQPRTLRILIPALVIFFLLILALLFMRGRANRQQNNAPEGDTVGLPVEADTIVPPTATVTVSSPDADETTVPADTEMLPQTEESELPSAINTAAATTTPQPTQTAIASPTAPPAETPTITPTAEPTLASCIVSPPFGWVRYEIQANDSLSSLGQATNTTVEQLQEVNCLDSILLSIGQPVWLPFVPTP